MTGRAALLLIDIQTGFDAPDWGARNNSGAERAAGTLLGAWRARGGPIVHVRHVSTMPGSPLTAARDGLRFKAEVAPEDGETIFEKSVNSAFIGTGLNAHLREIGADGVLIAGLTTPHCVSTTARMAANFGYPVAIAHDACAAFATNADTGWMPGLPQMTAEDVHRSALSHLHGEFAQVLSVGQIVDRRCPAKVPVSRSPVRRISRDDRVRRGFSTAAASDIVD